MNGFVSSGGRNLWSFLAPLAALLFVNAKAGRFYLGLWMVFFLGSLLYPFKFTEAYFSATVSKYVLAINLILFFSVLFFLIQEMFRKMQNQKELEKAKKIAEENAIIKSNFLSTMSHEIRTPLNSIIGMSELLLDEVIDPEQKDKVQTLYFSSNNLMTLVNDVLDFSKIESGKIELEKHPFNLFLFLKDLINANKILTNEKGLELLQNLAIDKSIVVESDYVRLSQILNNLITNAVKFTNKGWVKLSVKEEDSSFCFAVEDSGVGIPNSKLTHIFEQFSQVDSSISRRYGGTGLGLSISNNLCTLLGGELEVSSNVGVGTKFSFAIPMHKLTSKAKPSNINNKDLLNGIKILAVDDNIINLKVLQKLLSESNAEVIAVTSGEQAILTFESNTFDIVLMDLQMPGLDGFQATKAIQSFPSYNNQPIFALTAEIQDDIEKKIMLAGMSVYLKKPINKKILFQTILQYTNNKKINLS
jgi:signal transduction histidine kinase